MRSRDVWLATIWLVALLMLSGFDIDCNGHHFGFHVVDKSCLRAGCER